MSITSHQAALLLCRLPKVGSLTAKKLIDQQGSPLKVLEAKLFELKKIRGIGPSQLASLQNWTSYLSAITEEETFMTKQQLKAFVYGQKHYPTTLAHTADPPTVFFQKGSVNWANQRIISVVGTRTPSPAGREFCAQLIEDLAPYTPLIVSGFARGIDIVAHRKAVAMQLETVAVLGHSFGRWYPKEHSKEVATLLKSGAFVSEFWSSSPFVSSNFLRRNRIIAGLSHATIVVESGEKGGSLVTASQALAYGREVFAAPGRVSDSKSQGCLHLIKTDRARLITSAADIVQWLEREEHRPKPVVQPDLFVSMTAEEKEVHALLELPRSLDEIALKRNKPIGEVAAILLQMELKGTIRSLAGKRFEQV